MSSAETVVVVVGAGLSGLQAALRLKESDARLEVIVLEARERVGGRVWSKDTGVDSPGLVVDAGAQFVGPLHERVKAKCEQYGLEVLGIGEEGRFVQSILGKASSYTGSIPSLGVVALVDLHRVITKLSKLASAVPKEAPWTAAGAERLDSMTVQQWAEKESWSRAAKQTVGIMVKAVFGCEACELSMLYFLFYCVSNDSLEFLIKTSGGAQEAVVKGGTQQIAERMADELGREHIRLNSGVARVVYGEEGAAVHTKDDTIACSRVIFATAPPLLADIQFSPRLPYKRRQLHARQVMTPMNKYHLYYKSRFWREKGFNGAMNSDCWKAEHVTTDTMDNTQVDDEGVEHPCIVGFMAGKKAIEHTNTSEEERKTAITEQIRELLDDDRAISELESFVETVWSVDEVNGGTLAVCPPRTLLDFGEALRQPVMCLHWAGTETAVDFNGYMEGALQAGERAATEVLLQLKKSEE